MVYIHVHVPLILSWHKQLFHSKTCIYIHVLVGFSFGGMLACCVAARLWHSTTNRDVLLERVICITFAQPFLQIKMVEEQIEICQQFRKCIHSIFNKADLVPLMIRCLDLPGLDLPRLPLPNVKALPAPSDEFHLRTSPSKHTSRKHLVRCVYFHVYIL